jgi:acetyltransferase-like isoleucine patch superfamily enzyme
MGVSRVNLIMKIYRIKYLVTAIYHYVRWSWRFYSFGWRSRIGHCDMLTNPRAISIGRKVLIRKGARLEAVGDWDGKKPKIVIGDGTAAQFYFHCGAAESISIGENVLIAGNVYITDHDHEFSDPDIDPIHCPKLIVKPVVIEDGAWLGEGCKILKGVKVGKRAVIGANAVVTKDVPSYTIVGGVPARPIGMVMRPLMSKES